MFTPVNLFCHLIELRIPIILNHLPEALVENLFPRLSSFLDAAYIPWLMDVPPPSKPATVSAL